MLLPATIHLLALISAGALATAQTPAIPPAPNPPASTPAPAPAVIPEPPPRKFNPARQVRIDVLMVSLPESIALPLLPALRDPLKLPAAQARLLDLVGRGQATLDDWPEITTTSGFSAVCENDRGIPYPIAYVLPDPDQKPAPTTPAIPTPTNFESKNSGTTLEFEPVVSDDATAVSFNLVPQLIKVDHIETIPAGQDANNLPVTVTQPIFRTHHAFPANLSLRDGERRLIYVGKSFGQDASIHLFIVGAKILPPIHPPK